MTGTRDRITAFVASRLPPHAPAVSAETLLYTTGILDSFALVDLIAFLEEQMGHPMSPDDVTLENLDSIDRILRFLTDNS